MKTTDFKSVLPSMSEGYPLMVMMHMLNGSYGGLQKCFRNATLQHEGK